MYQKFIGHVAVTLDTPCQPVIGPQTYFSYLLFDGSRAAVRDGGQDFQAKKPHCGSRYHFYHGHYRADDAVADEVDAASERRAFTYI